jgi:hypothetical protein
MSLDILSFDILDIDEKNLVPNEVRKIEFIAKVLAFISEKKSGADSTKPAFSITKLEARMLVEPLNVHTYVSGRLLYVCE